ncbi:MULTISPECIES: hypothetical protein [Levilactobacillus]|uniref:Uncharacterized protein n=1 Tax=Levilactobacillus suantsaiihabitans TaxID=2487722 RepID=A0A4Z0JC76_9LACO|nr:hypothetical protein [Levilactobacillus suantsaiihabitans]TGD19475.1 hypothetical protein EGT51_04725 [Levilactobacillus suantsaiihabitans]
MQDSKRKIFESLIIDTDGNRYVGVKTLMQYFHESRASAYRRINRDFKNTEAIFHNSFNESIRVPGQRATTSGITLNGFKTYVGTLEQLEHEDEKYAVDLQEAKNHLNKEATEKGKSASADFLLGTLHSLDLSAGQQIADLQATVDSAAIVKVTNPFYGTYTFMPGNTYDEFLLWLKEKNQSKNSKPKIEHK